MAWYMWLATAALVIALGIAIRNYFSKDPERPHTHEFPDIVWKAPELDVSATVAGEEAMRPDGETVTRKPTKKRRQESRPRRKTMQ